MPRRDTQVGGTQTSPPPQPNKHTASGGTQNTPPQDSHQDDGIQGQLDHNQVLDDDWQGQDSGKGKSKGKKGKKKPPQDAAPHLGTSQGTGTIPQTNYTSRNLGTGRLSIQCTACREYTHWRKDCLYNFCTICNNHDHATMCVGPHSRALQFAFTVAAPITGLVIAPETPGTTENNCMEHLIL